MFTEKFIEYELIECKYFAGRNYTALQTVKFIESRYKIDNILCRLMLQTNEKNKSKAIWIKEFLVNSLYEFRLKNNME